MPAKILTEAVQKGDLNQVVRTWKLGVIRVFFLAQNL